MSYRAALEGLFARRRFGMRPGIDGTRALLERMGNPHHRFDAIHIAGTNGKGSTAAFAESILRRAGLRTGLFTSPHLCRFTERVRIDGLEIDSDELGARIENALHEAPDATFFEIATAAAFACFASSGVQIAVVEAGLGGRLDATNVLPSPRATVVTSIGLDHTEVLGPTLADIAREKAGIFKPGAPAILACDDAQARQALFDRAREMDVPVRLLGRDFFPASGELALSGRHQRANAALAIEAVRAAQPKISAAQLAEGLMSARWPGRLERIGDVLLDAAHNHDGALALADTLSDSPPVTLLFGVVSDKDAAATLRPLLPHCARLVFTCPPSDRARDPEDLRALADGRPVMVEPDIRRAFARAREYAREEDGGRVVVAGSIFLVGAVRALLTGERTDPFVGQELLAPTVGADTLGTS